MFYSHFILARKGPLGTIWIAAHLEGKLRKNLVTDTNIFSSVDSILFPDVPIALRLSGHLLLGVVRIYSRKVNYLYHDCSEALVKIKHAYDHSSVDLPPEASKVPFHSITLPETFDFDELEFSFKWDKVHASAGGFADHISARDLITLQDQTQEEAHGSLFDLDERFPGSSDPYSLLLEDDEEHVHEQSIGANQKLSQQQDVGVSALEEDILPPLPMDEDMELDREDVIYNEQGAPLQTVTKQKGQIPLFASHNMQDVPDIERLRSAPERMEPEPFLMELEEEEVPSGKTVKAPGIFGSALAGVDFHEVEVTPVLNETPLASGLSPITDGQYDKNTGNEDLLGGILGGRTPTFKVASSSGAVPESAQPKRGHRKRKAIFDHKPTLSSMAMKKQLAGADGLLRQNKRLQLTDFGIRRLMDSYNERRFDMPSFPGFGAPIKELYSRLTGLPSKEQSSSLPMNMEVLSQFNPDEVRVPEAEFQVPEIDPLDGAAAPFDSKCSPHRAQQMPNSKDEGIDINVRESQNQDIDEGSTGQQDKGATDSVPGRESPDARDMLPFEIHPLASSGQGDDMLVHPESLATQASSNGVNVVTPLFSPALTCPPVQSLVVRAHCNSVSPRLDFLEASKDNALFPDDSAPEDPFIDETDINSYRKERPYQKNYGWSVRTKGVVKYLKSVFEELESTAKSQPVEVSLDSLLKGRTRKEASRLFFETLVLKSRDYIDVEQRTGFAEIMLSATHLLRKDII